jgi:hypothetical protein
MASPPATGVVNNVGANPPAAGVVNNFGANPPAASVENKVGPNPPAAGVVTNVGANPPAAGVVNKVGANMMLFFAYVLINCIPCEVLWFLDTPNLVSRVLDSVAQIYSLELLFLFGSTIYTDIDHVKTQRFICIFPSLSLADRSLC